MALMFLFGLGLGNTMQPLTLAVQAVVDPRDMGMATSAATFFRQMGGTLGVAVFLSVLFNSVGDNIQSAFVAAAKDSSFVAALSDPAVLANPTNKAFVAALSAGHLGFSATSWPTRRSSMPSTRGWRTPSRSASRHRWTSSSSPRRHHVCAAGLVILLFMPGCT